jgi:type VI secretion system protein
MLVLTVVSHHSTMLGSMATKNFDEDGGTIGRARSNDWALPDPEKFMSGTHAKLLCHNSTWYIVDLSTNGVFVNAPDQRLGNGNQAQISEGDVLYIGEYEIGVSVGGEVGQSSDPFFSNDLGNPAPIHQDFGSVPDPLDVSTVDPLEALDASEESSAWHLETPTPSTLDEFGSSSSMHDSFSPPDTSAGAASSDGLIGDDWDVTDFSGAGSSVEKHFEIPEDLDDSATTENTFSDQVPDDFRLIPDSPSVAQAPPEPIPPAAPPPPMQAPPPMQEPPPMQAAPVTQTPPANPAAYGDVLQPILNQLGVSAEQLTPDQKRMLMENVSTMLVRVAKGMREVLAARASLKSEFRIAVTTIKHTENNPLKFSVSDEEALRRLLLPGEAGYMATEKAVEEAFEDLRAHQVGMLAGMRASFDMMAQEFVPSSIEQDCDGKSKGGLVLGSKKMKYWDHYAGYYDRRLGGTDDSFREYFGEEFVEAYDRQVEVMRNK